MRLMGRPSFHLSDELGRLLSRGRSIRSRTWGRIPRVREEVTGISVSSLYPVRSPSHSGLARGVTATPCSWVPHVHLHGFLPELFCFYASPPGFLQRVSSLCSSPTSLPSGCKNQESQGADGGGGGEKEAASLTIPHEDRHDRHSGVRICSYSFGACPASWLPASSPQWVPPLPPTVLHAPP